MNEVRLGKAEWSVWRRKMEAGAAVRAHVVAAWPGYLELDLGTPIRARARRGDLLPRPGSQRALDQFAGREIEGLVISIDPEERGVTISPRHLAALRFGQAHRDGRKVTGRVVDANQGGLMVEVEGALGFVPRPELPREQAEAHHSLVGCPWTGYVIKATQHKFILSSNPGTPPRPRLPRVASPT